MLSDAKMLVAAPPSMYPFDVMYGIAGIWDGASKSTVTGGSSRPYIDTKGIHDVSLETKRSVSGITRWSSVAPSRLRSSGSSLSALITRWSINR